MQVNPLGANHNCSRRQSEIFFHCFSEKIRLDVSSESSARQRIHIKNQALFSSKDKRKKLKCRLLQFSFGALMVNSTLLKDGKDAGGVYWGRHIKIHIVFL